MTYQGIDAKRFTYLLSLGASEFELRQFFVDSRIQLIQHGGKVQNLPQGLKARIRTLALTLPPSTDPIVRNWFARHLTMVDPEPAEATVGVFKRYEELEEVLPEDSARRFARSCLVHLFSKSPPSSLIDFLRTPVGGLADEQEYAADVGDDRDVQPKPVSSPYPANLPQVLVDLVEGKDADEHLEGFPPELANFISGLQAGAQGHAQEATEAAESLPADSTLRGLLQRVAREQEAASASGQAQGLRILDSETFQGNFDYARDEVLAYCASADRPTATFVRPLAAVIGGRVQFLTDETRHALFPETGDVIAFVGPGVPPQPGRGELGIWRVAAHKTTKATRFHLASEKRAVYEVRLVPFPSTDHDSVREFLKAYPKRSGDRSLQPVLFQLSDGLIIGFRGERADLTKEETFESGLLSWTYLPAIRFEGRTLVAGPLPKEQGIYECATLASAVRRLLRPRVGSGKVAGTLTKSQLGNLVQSLGSLETGLDALRAQRVRGQLEHLGEQHEALDALVDELMNHPNVRQRIDELVERQASELLDRKGKLQTDVARLQKERDDWEERLRKQRDEYRKFPNAISKAVKTAFAKARGDGMAALADVAVFQGLSALAEETDPGGERHAVRQGSLAQPAVRELKPSSDEAAAVLRAFGVPAHRAAASALLGEAAHRAGLMICVRGIAARPAVEGWARALKHHGIVIDSTLGLVEDAAVRRALSGMPVPGVLVLLDANFSALDIYARLLSDLVISRLAQPAAEHKLAIFLALADGIGALPLPKTFESLSALIDLDAQYALRSSSEMEDLMSEAADPDEGTLYTRLWRPAADRLLSEINKFEMEEKTLILSALAARR
jgi:hypothetical protein